MTLQQQIEQLIGEWDGSDATVRSQNRGQLVTNLMALVENRTAEGNGKVTARRQKVECGK